MAGAIVYIGSFKFPLGDAVAKRVYGIGQCLREIGYDCHFIGISDEVARHGGVSEDREYKGFKYCSIHRPCSSKEHLDYRSDLKAVCKKIDQVNESGTVKAVFFTGTICTSFSAGLVRHCKKRHIKIIADSMDWLCVKTGNILFNIIKSLDIHREICNINYKADGILTISEFLTNYYKKRGKTTVLIPPLSSYNRPDSVEKNKNRVPIIVYGGIPCRLGRPVKCIEDIKDRLDRMIELFYLAHLENIDFKFHVYGPNIDNYEKTFPEQKDKLKSMVDAGKLVFYGLVTEDIVEKAVRGADFTILLRDKNRTSMAGFPTKISESITLGVPVITTDTSDICKYLIDGMECMILDINDNIKAVDKLKKILLMNKNEIIEKKTAALANNSFEYRSYTKRLQSFLSSVGVE